MTTRNYQEEPWIGQGKLEKLKKRKQLKKIGKMDSLKRLGYLQIPAIRVMVIHFYPARSIFRFPLGVFSVFSVCFVSSVVNPPPP